MGDILPTRKKDGAYFHIQRQQISISEKDYRHTHREASCSNPGAQTFTYFSITKESTRKSDSCSYPELPKTYINLFAILTFFSISRFSKAFTAS